MARATASLESCLQCSPDSLPPLCFRSVRTEPQTRAANEVSTVVVSTGQIALAATMPMKPLYAGLITAAAIVGAILICVGCRRCQCARIKVQIARHRRDISTRQSRTQVGATGPATTTTAKQDDTSQASRTRRTRSSTSDTTTTGRPARRARSFSKRSKSPKLKSLLLRPLQQRPRKHRRDQ